MDLQENQSIQTLLKLFEENNLPDKAQDLSSLLFYVDGMERQFDAVVRELQEVKTQLADIKAMMEMCMIRWRNFIWNYWITLLRMIIFLTTKWCKIETAE